MAVGAVCRHEEFTPGRSGHLDDVWVAPEHRGRGLTTRMLRGLLEFFRDAGVEVLSLNYVRGNAEAEAVWTRLGFTPVIVTAVTTLDETARRLGGA
jgi:GNAT superfamily N-acetyltransferase